MVPKMTLIRGNRGLILDFMFATPKRQSLRRTARFAYFASKSVQRVVWTQKTNTFWCAISCAKSRMRANETPGRIVTNFCTGVGVHDVITSANFYDSRAYGVSAWWGIKFWASPLTCIVARTTLSHYRASVWLHQCLPLPPEHSPDGASPDWGGGHLLAAY